MDFFRGNGIIAALKMIKSMVFHINPWIFTDGSLLEMGWNMADWLVMIAAILVLLIVSILQRKYNLREKIANQNPSFRWVLYLTSIFAIIVFGIYGPGFDASSFIYMQF